LHRGPGHLTGRAPHRLGRDGAHDGVHRPGVPGRPRGPARGPPVQRRRDPHRVRQVAGARGLPHHVAVHPVGAQGLERGAAHRGTRGLRGPDDRLLQRGRAELQVLDPAPRHRRPARDGAGVRPDRRQHLPRRAVPGAAVPHAARARLRGLPHAGPRPVLRQLGDPRRRRRLRHPRLAGRPRGDRGPQGQPPGRQPRQRRRPCQRGGAQDHPAVMTDRLAPPPAGLQEDGSRLPAGPGDDGPAVRAMLEARRIALVGASARPGSFGERMVAEVARSPSRPALHLVNPRYRQIGGHGCVPSLADLPDPVDLVLLGVPDAALEDQLTLAARRGDRSAVIYGNAWEAPGGAAGPGPAPGAGPRGQPDGHGDHAPPGGPVPLRGRLAATARGAGMALCGAGCMGFVNVAHGLRAIGYVEPDPLPAGPVALVTHSGSVFSALLRTRRAIGYTLAVSSGQELVTPAAAYLEYALTLPGTKVIALVLEAMREPARLRAALAAAAARDIPVVLLTVGGSAAGRTMVAAHSGALAAGD